jgi:hypothetical protein
VLEEVRSMRAHTRAPRRRREEKPLVVEVTHEPNAAARDQLVELLLELLDRKAG